MFLFHLAFGIELISLAMGVGLLVWSMQNFGNGSTLAKIFGYIIMILAIFSILCTIYTGLRYMEFSYLVGQYEKNMMRDNMKMTDMMPMQKKHMKENMMQPVTPKKSTQ